MSKPKTLCPIITVLSKCKNKQLVNISPFTLRFKKRMSPSTPTKNPNPLTLFSKMALVFSVIYISTFATPPSLKRMDSWSNSYPNKKFFSLINMPPKNMMNSKDWFSARVQWSNICEMAALLFYSPTAMSLDEILIVLNISPPITKDSPVYHKKFKWTMCPPWKRKITNPLKRMSLSEKIKSRLFGIKMEHDLPNIKTAPKF